MSFVLVLVVNWSNVSEIQDPRVDDDCCKAREQTTRIYMDVFLSSGLFTAAVANIKKHHLTNDYRHLRGTSVDVLAAWRIPSL